MADVRFKGRVAVLATAVSAVFFGIGARLCVLQLKPQDWVLVPIQENRKYEWKPVGSRGRIVDRNGEILAMDMAAYHVVFDPQYIRAHGEPETVVKYISEEFAIPEAELRGHLEDSSRRWVAVMRYVPESRLKRFERRSLGVVYVPKQPLENGATNVFLRGVKLEETSIRNYPKGPLMAHVVGFSNLEGVGSAGIEQRMDEFLRGKEGLRISLKDGKRREIYGTRTVDIPPEDGATVVLTLDQQLQDMVEKTVEKMCIETHAPAGWAIVQRVGTGEILAMASYPTYDPNRYSNAPAEWMRNRAISVNYEPGSVMKAAVISSALDRGIVREDDIFDCENGYWVYGGKALRDSHGMEKTSVADIVKHSSNIGTAKIALEMGEPLLYESLKAFQFGNRLGIGLAGEEGGILYAPGKWSKISITRIGMGQEIATTALQMLSMMSAIACNGVQMKPYLVQKVVAADGTVLLENKPEELGRPLSPEGARRMQRLLSRVTDDDGTAPKAQVEGYTVAGKTGTAQKVRPVAEGGGYYQKNFVSSFAGFIPAQSPEISIIVVADDPGIVDEKGRKTKYFGGTVCGPAFREIAEFAVRYLRIAPDGNRIYVVRPDE